MSSHSILVVASEKDKINYHMTMYQTSHELSKLLKSIGFSKIEKSKNQDWFLYTIYKSEET